MRLLRAHTLRFNETKVLLGKMHRLSPIDLLSLNRLKPEMFVHLLPGVQRHSNMEWYTEIIRLNLRRPRRLWIYVTGSCCRYDTRIGGWTNWVRNRIALNCDTPLVASGALCFTPVYSQGKIGFLSREVWVGTITDWLAFEKKKRV